ncbi:MAG: exodeoxyribonuclease III [Gammaproteobacteria bacterium]|nr:exodeoxyribonuclease III [Gammaproteobacteria bacterium]
MKIATWNVNSLRVRLPHVLQWLDYAKPDVLALQETKLTDENFPVDELRAAGYRCVFSGQPTYNGVAILSKQESVEIVTDIPGFEDTQRRVLGATCGGVRILNLYVPNGQSVESDKYHYKLEWLKALQEYVKTQLTTNKNICVLGDFNIAPEDRDVHDPEEWRGKVLCSDPERAAFRELLALGLEDSFRLFDQAEASYSWWDYRAAAFRRNRGLRIDLILASKPMAEACTGCHVDREPRAWERPSDHTPVVAEFRN